MHGYYVELCNSITCIVLYHVIVYVWLYKYVFYLVLKVIIFVNLPSETKLLLACLV